METLDEGGLSASDSQEDKATKAKRQSKTTLVVAIIAVLSVIGVTLFFLKGFFIAATVNGEPISRLAVIDTLEKEAGAEVVDGLISEKLIWQAAKEADIEVGAEEVAAEIYQLETEMLQASTSLDVVLAQQGLTRETLEEQIKIQKTLEALVGTDGAVTDGEIDQFVEQNGLDLNDENIDAIREQIKSQLEQQKMTTAVQNYVSSLRLQADINYYVTY